MDDLEITKLCAEAMGLFFGVSKSDPNPDNLYVSVSAFAGPWMFYDPLHDDAQAMALVKKMCLDIIKLSSSLKWRVYYFAAEERTQAIGYDLNRAICTTVAKMQQAKNAA